MKVVHGVWCPLRPVGHARPRVGEYAICTFRQQTARAPGIRPDAPGPTLISNSFHSGFLRTCVVFDRDSLIGKSVPASKPGIMHGGGDLALFERLTRIAPRAALGLLAALTAGSCGRSRGDVVRIGVAGSFSDPIGLPMKQAAELAAEEINAAGGINGRRLELILRDDYADPDSAVFIANDLYASGVSAVVGHLFSGETLAAAPVYNGGADPLVAISPSSSSPDLTTAGTYTFRVCPSDLAHGAVLAHWVRDRLHLDTGALLYLNDEYGRGIRQTFANEYARLGGELQSVDPYLGDKPEVGPYLDRLAQDRGRSSSSSPGTGARRRRSSGRPGSAA